MIIRFAFLTTLFLTSLASANSATPDDLSKIIKSAGFQLAPCQISGGLGTVCAYLEVPTKVARDKLQLAAEKQGWKLKGKWVHTGEYGTSMRYATYLKGDKLINLRATDLRPALNLRYISGDFDPKP